MQTRYLEVWKTAGVPMQNRKELVASGRKTGSVIAAETSWPPNVVARATCVAAARSSRLGDRTLH